MGKGARLLAVAIAGCVAFMSLPFSMAQATEITGERAAGKTAITGLTTEYQTDPLGIEPEDIHFGWKMESTTTGAKQTAYQIKVMADKSVVWDSGKVQSDRSTGIACGKSLAPRTSYNWEVTVWDQAGESYRANAAFETGVTNLQEWKDAEFISMNKNRLAPIFRCEQALTKNDIKKARLYITALGAYQAYVNGNRVGELDADGNLIYHHMNPGYGNARVSLGYQTYDVTPFLAGARSAAVSVSAGTGWYNGMGEIYSQPAVKALLMIDYNDGSQQVLKTNTTDWKGTLAGGITTSGIYYGEDYNTLSAKELGDYTQVGYDDSAWVNALGSSAEAFASPCITNSFDSQTASYVRLTVQEAGPAVLEETGRGENFLQIMEMELLDGQQNNMVRGIVPQINNTWSPIDQWAPKYLTDGDLGLKSDKGFTTNKMGSSTEASYTFADPVVITFALGQEVSFETMKLYPRTAIRSVSGNECPAYPKKYTLEISHDGNNWTPVDLNGTAEGTGYTVESLRNTELFPEVEAEHIDTEFGGNVTAKKVKISVSQVGPAIYEAGEQNRLQIMELELWNGVKNVAKDVVPTVTTDKPFDYGDTWKVQNLTDGDYGVQSDKGYSTEVLGNMKTSCDLENPVTIEFDFDKAVTFSSLRIFPRSMDSIVGGIYPNYPKIFTVSVSENGIDWRNLVTNEDKGMVRKKADFQNMKMTTNSFPGVIRAQNGLPGRMTGKFDQNPVSAYKYSGNKAVSEYIGGEVNITAEYKGKDMFAQGVELKKGETMVVNMGQNLTAVPDIRFSGNRGTLATLRFAEMLNDGSHVGTGAADADGPKGSIYQYSLRTARSKVTYVFAGDEIETYQPTMSFFGYQYVEITANDDIKIYGLTSKGISSVSDQTGQIITNNQDVNKLFSNVLYGQLSNYYTAPTDCNQRDERLSWTGDTQAFVQTAVYNFDSYAFLMDIQDIFAENAKEKGYVASVVDRLGNNELFGNWATGWSDALVIVPWTLYLQTGNISILEENWDVLQQYMTFLKNGERSPNHCMIPNNGMNYGDWLSSQGTCVEVISDYYYGYVNQIMAQIAGILGKEQEKTIYEQKFAAIKQAFLDTHVTFSDGNLVIKSAEGNADLQCKPGGGGSLNWENNSQTSLIWMLKLGFYENEAMRGAAEKLLVENIKNENPDPNSIRSQAEKNTLAVGFLGANVITPVLSDTGNAEVSYDLLLQSKLPSWLFEVRAGATTIWERWNSYDPGNGFGNKEMNSFNHYAYGSVVEWMYRYMAGISSDVKNPGFKNIILQPTLDTGNKYNEEDRINSVDASYESVYGKISSSWKSEEGRLVSYHTRIPANTTATLYLPVEDVTADILPKVEGVMFQGMTEHNGQKTAEFTLESGGYDFKVTDGKLTIENSTGDNQKPQEPQKPQKPTIPTLEQVGKNNPGLPKGSSEESRNSTFRKLAAQVTKSTNASNKLKWTKVKDADGYIVLGNKCGKSKYKAIKIINKNKTVSFTHKKLKKGTYYKYIIQAYKMKNGKLQIIATSKTVHAATTGGKVGNAKAVKVNKSRVSLAKKGRKFTIKAKEVKKGKTIKRHRKVMFESSNTRIATVNSKGVITAKKKGICYIYVYAQNGVYKKVKVTVKK